MRAPSPGPDTLPVDLAGGTHGDRVVDLPGRWRLESRIGRGGQAEVWLARDAELDQFVAIKVFRAELTATQRERLRREVTLGRTLQHPGLVRVFELIDGGDRLAVAMEWVPEGSLAQRLESGRLPVDEVVRVAEQVLEVLAYLHLNNVVHRDVKPSNLLVDSGGRIRLADLGLARPLDDDRGLTRTLAAVGTPAYMSPEQIRGEAPAPAADLYGLGVTLYQLVTGELPFSGTSEYDVANKHLTEPVVDPRRLQPGCPAWLAGFILRLLEKSPRDRFAGATSALDALRRRRAWLSPRAWRRAAIVAGVVVVVVGSGTAALVASRSNREVVQVTSSRDTISALDAHGRVLWSRRFDGAEPFATVGDVVGDRRPEVVVGVHGTGGQPAATRDLVVLDKEGSELLATASGRALTEEPFREFADRTNGATPLLLDLTGDGLPEIVWSNHHAMWYPSVLGVWDARSSNPPWQVLVNSGTVEQVRGGDLDGDGRRELVALVMNNPMGWQQALVILKYVVVPGVTQAAAGSPDQLLGWKYRISWRQRAVVAYVPLGAAGGGAGVISAGRDGIEVRRRDNDLVRLDADGNPDGSPLHGMGGAPRERYWDELALLCLGLETRERPATDAAALRARNADVMAERPMRLATALLVARSLARAGNHPAAIGELEGEVAVQPAERDLHLRLGEYLSIAGASERGMAELRRAAAVGTVGRTPLDALAALAMVASATGSRAGVDQALASLHGVTSDDTSLAPAFEALWSFCRGRWDDPALAPGPAVPDLPEVDVLREWASLERGSDAIAGASRAEALAANPEVRALAHVLQAHALVRAGRAAEAQGVAAAAIEPLTRRSRTDVAAATWVALAHRVSGEVAGALGDGRGAAEHYREAARIAPKCWFGETPKRS